MTRIDFYIANKPTALQLACRVIEKIHALGHHLYIFTESQGMSEALDKLLWEFKPDNFIPHQIYQPGQSHDEQILISHQTPPMNHQDVLVNLNREVPVFFSRFNRVAEIVEADETLKLIARARYKYYRENGYELHTHNL